MPSDLCTPKELDVLLDKWIVDGVFKPNQVFREPTEKEQRDLRFCSLHNYVQHLIAECWVLCRLVHRKGKGVAAVVICVNPGENEEENPALPTAAITTL